MAISSITTVYTDRKIDLHIMQGVNAPSKSSITPSFGLISNYCTGVQKLIQRYMIMLLTEIGSQENYPDFGSDFLVNLLSSSSVYNRVDLQNLFAFANAKVSKAIIDYQIENELPLDEQLNTASLVDIINIAPGHVSLKIQIIPQTQDAVEFVVPLPN